MPDLEDIAGGIDAAADTNITDTTDGADSADTTDETRDADAFENLNQGSSFSSAAIPEQVQYIELSEAV